MERFKVKKSSANIDEVIYSEKTRTLYINFDNNGEKSLYEYANVTLNKYNRFKKADSKGKFFHTYINNVYDSNLIKKF